jgi:hypothetical protein
MESDLTPQPDIDANLVTKAQVFAFLESQFCLADQDKDGSLNLDELQTFIDVLCHPATKTARFR